CENTTGNRFYVTSNSGRNYNWTIVGGTITSGQGSNLVTVSWGAATSTASISVTETISATNCSNSTSNNLVIIPKPTPSIVVSNNFVCANQINAVYSTASVVGSNYVWNIIGGTITSGQGEHEVKVSWGIANPSASISVTQTAANFCTQIASKSIIVNPLPVPNISGDVAVCESSTNNIYSTNFTTGNSYFWLVVGGTITAGQNTNQITVTWGSAGIGSVSVDEKIILTNCIVTTTQNITINTLPTPNITNNNITNNVAICETSIGNIYEVINSVSNTYLWDVTGGVITNGQNINKITVTWGSAGTGIVKVTETITATGCSQISTQNIIINPLPTPNIQPISGLFSVCAGSVQNYKIVNNLTNQNYNWVVTGGSITSGQGTKEISVTWGTNPIGEVEITQTNNITNCSKLDSKNILINPLPTPNIIGNTTVCAFESGGAFGNIFTYTTSSVSGHLYNWTIGSNGTIITGQGSNSITVKWANQSAAYVNTLRVTQTSNSIPACVVSHEINVNVKPVPVLDVNVEYLCFGDITKFTPSVIDTTWTRNWSIISDGFVSAASIPTFVFANTGIKTLTLTVTNADNCQYIITKTFVISPVPSPNYTFTGTCLGNITSFKDTSNVATANGNSIVTRIWDFGDGSPLLSGNFTNPTHNYTTAGTYTTSLTTITNNNCSKTLSKIINIFPSFSPSDVAPYSESFDAGSRGWIAGSYDNTLSTWNLGNSSPTRTINNGNTGDFWSTGLGANYTNSQRSYVESPCFNLSGLTRPMLSIKKWSDAEEGLDGTVILYTTNQGLSWKVLGDVGQGSSWYNQTNVLSSPGPDDETINPRRLGWTGRDGNWINARFALDVVKAEAGGGSVRFRVAFSSNADNLPGTWDGFAFDDFRILNRDGKVLLEHFTNMVSTTENDVVDNFPPESVKIQYHTNLGNDNNKLYQENKPDGGARALFYGISQVERGAMNGKPNVQEPFSVWGNNQYLQNSLNSPKFDVKITFPPITPTNGILNINVAVKANLAQNTPVLVHIVLVEKQVTSAQLGMTGTTIYKNIVRKMLPSAGGTFVSSAWNPNDLRNFSQNIPIYAVAQENEAKFYDWNNLSVVAFVQDYTTQEVYQSDQASPTTLPTLISAVETDAKNQCWIYPNPTSDEVFIGFKEEVTRSCVWEIYTMQGVKVSQGNINENEKGIRIDVTKYPKGMYIVKIIEPTSKLVWQSKLQIR
ncbi:MAG: T9SS C-terminal target domain-containing protein, partial [Bacteroidetes bacterium]